MNKALTGLRLLLCAAIGACCLQFVGNATAAQSIRLDELDLADFTTGWGQIRPNQSVDGRPLTLGGVKFEHGVGVHAASQGSFALDGQVTRFRATVGVDDEVAGQKASLEFMVSSGGKELWRSGVMRAGDAPKIVEVPLAGLKSITLAVSDGGDGSSYDHADWADARFEFGGVAPFTAPDPGRISIKAGRMAMVLRVGEDKRLYQAGFGDAQAKPNRKPGDNDEAFPSGGERSLLEPALRAVHADGNTSTVLEFVRQTTGETAPGVTLTRLELKDPLYPFFVTLVFRAYAAEGVIEQWVEIRHEEAGAVTLEQFASSATILGNRTFFLTHYSGDWADEMNVTEERLTAGSKVIGSRAGSRAQLNRNPSFLLSAGAVSQENSGEVFGATFAYSGNFQFQFEVDPGRRLRAICGMNPEASAYHLKPGESFVTPAMLWSWSGAGRGELARSFAHWGRKYGMRDGGKSRDVLLNNWEATFFKFDETKLVSLFDGARDLGFELFLLDDGWFANKYPRDDDTQGLGDWGVNTNKLPRGISFLTEEAKKRGVRFGLWFEPEMVNPRSELFEQHPDWVIRQPGRPLAFERNQLVLDLSNPAVREYAFRVVDDALTQNPGISFVKWDCNRTITQAGSAWLKPGEQSHLYIEYVRSLYDILDRIAARHPDVQLMICSGGGGRVDYGALRRGHEFWPSDNTDPLRRITMQWAYEQFFPQNAIAAHVTGWNKRPLKFAFDVAMSARLGMDMDTAHFSPEDRDFSRTAIATYKTFRDVVQLGELYRLESPLEGARASQMNVSPDRAHAVVFAWQMKDGQPAPLVLQGLDPAKRYGVREVNLRADRTSSIPENAQELDGATLMRTGLSLPLTKQFDSTVVELLAK